MALPCHILPYLTFILPYLIVPYLILSLYLILPYLTLPYLLPLPYLTLSLIEIEQILLGKGPGAIAFTMIFSLTSFAESTRVK